MNSKNKGQVEHLANNSNKMIDKDKQIVCTKPEGIQISSTKLPEGSISLEELEQDIFSNTQPDKEFLQHTFILSNLEKQVQPIDYQALAYPEVIQLRERLSQFEPESDEAKELRKQIEKKKVGLKYFLVITIDQLLKLAASKNWGLCKNLDFIYVYNGKFWAEVDKEAFQKFLGKVAVRMGTPELESKYFEFKDKLFKQFLASAYLPRPEENPDKVLINLQNGTFEISATGNKLKKFNHSDFLTYQLPFEYNPEAEAPLFEKYLNRVLPDKDRQRVLAEYLGYIFIKHGSRLKLETALVLYGTGGNGKSVLFEVITALLGRENVSNYSLEELTDSNGYHRAKIANKLLNYASEINGRLEVDTFKKMVSGEPVAARLPYGQPMELRQYAKFIFNSNELPKDVEHTQAFFRRWLIIPFDVTIPKEEQDKELHSKIIDAELSGVFNWILQGLERLLAQKKFSDCEAARKAVEEYQITSDSVKLFLEEQEFTPSFDSLDFMQLKEIYPDYRDFCSSGGFKPCDRNTFSKRMQGAGYEKKRRGEAGVGFLISKK